MGGQAVKFNLGFIDYAVFITFMLVSVGVGIYHAILEKKKHRLDPEAKDRAEQYLMGGRDLPIIPVALSIVVSFLSGIALLGSPAEIFQHGGLWIIKNSMAPVALVISGFLFVPIFYNLQLVSIYEYIEIRFHSPMLRKFCAFAYAINTVIHMGVSIYSPAIALSGVTNLEMWMLILLVGVTSTVYTTMGGLKAVVWSDTIQAGVMYVGLLFIIIRGTIDAGGISQVFHIFFVSGRWKNTWRFDPNPAQYYNIWNAIFGGIAMWLSMYGLNQMSVQRYCSLQSVEDAKKVVWMNIPFKIFISLMICYMGLLVLAFFYNCNPLETGEIATLDQLSVLLAAKVSQNYPGVIGLFIACLFAGTLSVVSGGYNSLAAVVFKDLIEPTFGSDYSPKKKLWVNKGLVFCTGISSTALAYVAGPLGGILKTSIGLLGATNGPIVGLFLVGLFCRSVSTRAVTISFVITFVGCALLWIDSVIENPYKGYVLPTNSSDEGCHGKSFVETRQPDYDPHYGRPDATYVSRISQLSYGFLSKVVVFVLSISLSLCIRPKNERYSSGRRPSLTLFGRPQMPVGVPNNIGQAGQNAEEDEDAF